MKARIAVFPLVFVGALALSVASPALCQSQTDGTAGKDDNAGGVEMVLPSDELLAWAEGMSCTSCHKDQAGSYETEGCLTNAHGAFLDCISCHADDKLMKRHEGKTEDSRLPKKLKKTKANSTACFTCHKVEVLAEKTEESKALEDKNGLVVNPHALPECEKHDLIGCLDCHQGHTGVLPEKSAPVVCANCHHTGTFECNTCHTA